MQSVAEAVVGQVPILLEANGRPILGDGLVPPPLAMQGIAEAVVGPREVLLEANGLPELTCLREAHIFRA